MGFLVLFFCLFGGKSWITTLAPSTEGQSALLLRAVPVCIVLGDVSAQPSAVSVWSIRCRLVVDEERLVDWALESLGGRIVTAETAPPLIKPPSW